VRSAAGALLAGNTFDGWDFLAYALGAGVAMMWDMRARRAMPPAVRAASPALSALRL